MKIKSFQNLALTLGIAIAGNLFAQDGVRLNKTVIHPYAEAGITYDDNVFSAADGSGDSFLDYAAGLKLLHETDRLNLDSSAWVAQRKYDQYTEKDAERWGIAGLLNVLSDKSRIYAGFNVRNVDDYDDAPASSQVPDGFAGTVDQAFDRTSSEESRRISDFNAGMDRQVSDDIGFSLGYSFYDVSYDDLADSDWHENAIGTEFSLRLTDKTFSYLNAQYALQSGDALDDDGEATTVRIGLKNQLTDKSTLRAGVGVTRYVMGDEDYTQPSFQLNATWQASKKILLFADGRNEFQPTTAGSSVQMTTRASGGIRYQPVDQLGFVLSGAIIRDKDEETDDKSTQKVGTVRMEYSPIAGLTAYASVQLTSSDADASADYDKVRSSLGLKYMF